MTPQPHFDSARDEVCKILQDSTLKTLASRLCLIVDLHGRFRLLVDLDKSHDESAFKSHIEPKLIVAGSSFWTGEIWFDRDRSHPQGRVRPSEKSLYESVWQEAKAEPAGNNFSFVLHRRFSKDAWFQTRVNPPWPLVATKTPPIISFYSFKGGAGRTTAMASVAIQAARAGKRVLVVDLDLEAPGLNSIFPPPSGAAPSIGIVDYLLEKPILQSSFDINEMVHIYADKAIVGTGEIRIVGAGHVDDHYLEKLSRLDYQRLVPSSPTPSSPHTTGTGNSLLNDLLRDLKEAVQPDILLIDSRAGLHDIGGLALSSLAHWHVTFGLDSEQSWAGLRLAIAHLGRERLLDGQAQQDCLIVQAQVKPDDRVASEDRFRRRSYEIFSEVYYDAPGNANAEWPVPDEMANDEPHFPVSLVHDTRIMGYSSANLIADYLCEGDYKRFAEKLLGKAGLTL
jgi:Mrp family chromosome partitioning ATPase